MVKYFVDFTGARARDWIEQAGGIRHFVVSEVEEVRQIFDQLIRCAGLPEDRALPRVSLALELLILRAGDLAVPERGPESAAWETFQRIDAFLRREFLNLQSLDEVAAACHVSKAYVCRCYRRYQGHSPYQTLLQLKMAHAASLLLNSGKLVKEIAATVGIDDAFRFSKVFKQIYGTSPESFRRKRR